MNDPNRPPGFAFAGLRLIRSSFELLGAPIDDQGAELVFNYDDNVKIDGQLVTVTQSLAVALIHPTNKEQVYLRAFAELEGRFQGSEDANLTPEQFGNDHAPAILYSFTREWIHRLTSAADPWPPIVMNPANVFQLRQNRLSKPE